LQTIFYLFNNRKHSIPNIPIYSALELNYNKQDYQIEKPIFHTLQVANTTIARMTKDSIHLNKTSSVQQHDKSQESDSQMLIRVGKKFGVIFVIIFMFDTLVDWVLGVLDFILEGLHIVIEAIEYSIELILEHSLHTDHHQSEIIIVNATAIIALFLLYRLYIAIPKLYSRFENKCLFHFNQNCLCWQATPLIRKIKLFLVYCLGISCVLFLISL